MTTPPKPPPPPPELDDLPSSVIPDRNRWVRDTMGLLAVVKPKPPKKTRKKKRQLKGSHDDNLPAPRYQYRGNRRVKEVVDAEMEASDRSRRSLHDDIAAASGEVLDDHESLAWDPYGCGLQPTAVRCLELYFQGVLSAKDCCLKSGYTPKGLSAQEAIDDLLQSEGGKKVGRLLRQEYHRRYDATLEGQMVRLRELSLGAEKTGKYSAAISAEKLRAAMAGLTTDRRANVNEDVPREKLLAKLKQLSDASPQLREVLSQLVTKSALIEADASERPNVDVGKTILETLDQEPPETLLRKADRE